MEIGPPCFPCWVSWHCYENTEKTANLQDFPADRWAKWAPSHTTAPPHCAVTPAFLCTQFFTTGARNSRNILFLPLSLYVRAECGSVCLYHCTEGPQTTLCILWQTPEGSQSSLTHTAGSWDVAMIPVRKQLWSSIQQFQLKNKTQRSLIWAGCNPSAQVWWESEICLSSELTQCLQQLKNFLCMPCPLNESRIGHWCQSSPAALKQQPGLGAGHKPPPVWHCPCHSASTGTSSACPGNKLLCRGQWECNQPNRNDPVRIKGKKSKNEGEERNGGKE